MARLVVLNLGKGAIQTCTTTGAGLTVLIDSVPHSPDGVVVDDANGHLYWTNMGAYYRANDGFLERADLDGTNRRTLIPSGGTCTPKQLAADWAHGKLYWCDREGMRVMRANLDGSGVETIVQNGSTESDREDETTHCVGIALDPDRGYVYWTQKGAPNAGEGRIFRAPMRPPAGTPASSRTDIELLWASLPEPIDLSLDPDAAVLYWTDRGAEPEGNTLNRAELPPAGDTGEPPEVLDSGYAEAIGLVRDAESGSLFVTDLGGHVRKCDPERKTSEIVVEPGDKLSGIAVTHRDPESA